MMSGIHRPTLPGCARPLRPANGPAYTRLTPDLTVTADAQVQNVRSGQVYVFGDADLATDEEIVEFEMSQLPTRRQGKGKRKRKKSTNASDTAASQPLIFECKIDEGDTLQKIAIKYGCQVAHLKRLNNLMNDQEFFGRKTIRVPIKRHGMMTEIIAKQNEENNSNMHLVVGATGDVVVPVTDTYFDSEDEGDEQRGLLVRTLSIRDAFSNPGKEAQAWLKKMDKDINQIVSSTNTSKDNLDEVALSLTCKRIQPMQGEDCGIKRSSALTTMVAVVIIIPLLFICLLIWSRLSSDDSDNTSTAAGKPVDMQPVPVNSPDTTPSVVTELIQTVATTTMNLLNGSTTKETS